MSRRPVTRVTLVDQLRTAIRQSGLSAYQLGEAAGCHRATITRFVAGQAGLTLDVAAAIAEVLGLRLVESGRRRSTRVSERAAAPVVRRRGLGARVERVGPDVEDPGELAGELLGDVAPPE